MNKIIFKEDSRDKIFKQYFGQVVTLPDEFNVDTANYDDVQPNGDVKCTCYATCDSAEDQTNIIFDIDDLWNRIPQTQFGADPREVLKEAVKNGLKPVGANERLKNWASFWRADQGLRDPFDNVRSAIYMTKSPVQIGTYWYYEWLGVDVLPIGKSQANGHMYNAEGWKQVNGQPHLIIEAWAGKKMYMSREVFNEAMKPYGMQTWVLSTSDIDEKRTKSIYEVIRDACINVIILLKQLIVLKKAEEPQYLPETKLAEPEPVLPKRDLLEEFCLAIRDFEGKPGDLNYQNNNPGNCVYSSVGYDKKYGNVKKRGRFAVFPTYELGFLYLKNLVKSKAKEHPEWTIYNYFADEKEGHAPASDNNNPNIYASYVAGRLKILVTTKLNQLF